MQSLAEIETNMPKRIELRGYWYLFESLYDKFPIRGIIVIYVDLHNKKKDFQAHVRIWIYIESICVTVESIECVGERIYVE